MNNQKLCRKCKCYKNKQGFYTDNICKVCGERYPKRMLQRMYTAQHASSKKRGLPLPNYTEKEFISFVITNPKFRPLYIKWIKSGFNTMLKPSVDRIKESESYSLDNIQVVDWQENKRKGERDCKDGKRYHIVKSVCAFDYDTNEFIEQFHSIHNAESEVGIKFNIISSACYVSNKHKGVFIGKGGKYRWMFTLDYLLKTINEIEETTHNSSDKIHHSKIQYNEDTCLVSILP